MPTDPASILRAWLGARLEPGRLAWLDERCGSIAAGGPARTLFMSVSAAARQLGRDPLALTDAELKQAAATRPGWDPRAWTRDQAGRALLLLRLPHEDAAQYVDTLDRLFENGDLAELVALYQALPLLPHPESHAARCREGLRTNMTAVFCAVAHRNPYPAEWLDEPAWNQMVLKALFVGVALGPMHGLDERANPALMSMLCDYAHERWAAGRPVSPELWRCVGPYADEAGRSDLERALTDESESSRHAAALALRSCPHPAAAAILERHPLELDEHITWADLAPRSTP